MRQRRPSSLSEGLVILADDACELVALPIALLEYYFDCFHQAFIVSHPENDPYLRPWKVAKDAVLLSLLAAAFLQYQFLTVMVEIATLPAVTVHV